MTTCAECRYHHDRGCYIAPVSVFRLATSPACAQFAARGPQEARRPTPEAVRAAYGPEIANAIPNHKENQQ